MGSTQNYYSIANCQAKIPAIFLGIFGNGRDVSKFVYLYSTIPRVTLDGKCETLTYYLKNAYYYTSTSLV